MATEAYQQANAQNGGVKPLQVTPQDVAFFEGSLGCPGIARRMQNQGLIEVLE